MSDFHSLTEIAEMLPILAPPLADSAAHFARALGQPPSGWPGDGPPDPPDADPDPPADDDPPEDVPEPPQDAAVHVPDEVLAPEALVPAASILARLETLPQVVAAQQRATELVAQTACVGRIVTAADRDRADALRDANRAHADQVEAFLGKAVDASNKLHKGLTGLRSWMLGDVQMAAKRLGDGIAASIRAEQEAEAARQRKAREEAVAAERARLQEEARAADAERTRLAEEASKAQDAETEFRLREQAENARIEAEAARQEAASVTAPPVAQLEVAKPDGSSAADNWQALPAHSEDRDDMPVADKTALIIFVGERLALNDGSFIHLLSVDWKAAKALAKAQKSTMRVPGLRAVNPPTYRKTSRG